MTLSHVGGAERRVRWRKGPLVAWGAVPLVVWFTALMVVPAGILVLYSFWTPAFFAVEQVFTLDNYVTVFAERLYWGLLLKTFGLAFLSALLIVIAGFVLAFAITFRFGVWGPRILVLVMLTLLSSYIVRLYGLTTILGTNGLINSGLMMLGVIDQPLTFLLFGNFAIVVTLVYVYLPIAMLPIYAALQGIDPRVLEASRDLGAGAGRTFWTVTLPLALPGIRIGFAFAFILTASDYVAPRVVGGLDGMMVGAVIADQFGGASNFPLGAALAIVMVLGFGVVLVLTHFVGRVLGRCLTVLRMIAGALRLSRYHATMPGAWTRLGHLPWWQAGSVLILVFLLAPLATVVVFSFNTTSNPGLPLEGLTWHWYLEVVQRDDFLRVLQTSLIIAVATVFGGLVIGVPCAIALSRRRFALRRSLSVFVFGPMAIPGVIIGVALMTAFIFADIRLGVGTTQAAHVLLVTPFIVLVVRTRLEKLDPRIEEAARDLGSTPWRVFRTISLPLIAPSLLGAGILAAAVSLDELLVTNFTIGRNATIPVWIASQMRSGLSPSINAVAVMMLVGSLILIGLSAAALSRRRTVRFATTVARPQDDGAYRC